MSRAPRPQPISDGGALGQQTVPHQRIKRHLDRPLFRVPFSFRRRRGVEAHLMRRIGDSEGSLEDNAGERLRLDPFVNNPTPKNEKPMLKVRFEVSFRCHSRQLLCMGGSQFPFGWSFVSIAKLPMTWNPADKWTAEVYLPLGMRLEYKYVILEEQVRHASHALGAGCVKCQVWTNQQNEDSEGVVEVTYRSGNAPGQPPDVQKIRKQMAIVDWQPGPNRVVQIPEQDEIDRLEAGKEIQRTPARPRSYFSFRKLDSHPQKSSLDGTWETLSLDANGEPVLVRHDIWPNRGTFLSFEDARRFFLGE